MSESPQRRYWLIAPGERARLWDAFQSEGIMAIGWDYLGDLTQYETQEEITARMASEEPSKSKPTNNSKACFQFAHEIKAGDIVIAKQGSSAYLGYGIVRGSYRYEEGRPEYRHLRDVDWKKSGHWIDNDGPIVQKTLTDITIYPIYVKKLVRLLGIAEAAQGGGHDSPLNQILYGPPGTGKTYHTIDLAAKIIGFDTGDHEANLREFNKRLGKNIEFVTFHQSFTYEDFVEGIKPETTETKDRGKQVTYEVQDGIFKLMAQRAEKAGLNRETQAAQVEFERAFEALRSEMEASETDEVEIPMKRVSFNITAIGPNAISFRKHSGGTGHILRIDTLRKVYTGVLDYPNNGLGGYYHPLVDYLREKSQTAPQTAAENAEVPHVLIIDEINRGNVAAIFGELITLIETDKRSGGKHPLRLTLPYSKAEFSVPSNLYLIGTMNTADRSVEALDTALRRRFSFTEMAPKAELLDGILTLDEGGEIALAQLLSIINQRIAALIDRDHCIGHAYFMGIDEAEDQWAALQVAFHRNILPLLQEYFFGDHGKIGLVLGAAFVQAQRSRVQFADFVHDAAQDFAERPIYRLTDVSNMDSKAFQSAVASMVRSFNSDSDA